MAKPVLRRRFDRSYALEQAEALVAAHCMADPLADRDRWMLFEADAASVPAWRRLREYSKDPGLADESTVFPEPFLHPLLWTAASYAAGQGVLFETPHSAPCAHQRSEPAAAAQIEFMVVQAAAEGFAALLSDFAECPNPPPASAWAKAFRRAAVSFASASGPATALPFAEALAVCWDRLDADARNECSMALAEKAPKFFKPSMIALASAAVGGFSRDAAAYALLKLREGARRTPKLPERFVEAGAALLGFTPRATPETLVFARRFSGLGPLLEADDFVDALRALCEEAELRDDKAQPAPVARAALRI